MGKTLKVTCIITGMQSVMSGNRLCEQIRKYETVDNIVASYVHRKAARLLKKGYDQTQIRSILNVASDIPLLDDDKFAEIQSEMCSVQRQLIKTNLPDVSELIYDDSDPKVKEFIKRIGQK